MKTKYLVPGIILLSLASFSYFPTFPYILFSTSIDDTTLVENYDAPPLSCTIISQAIGDTVLFGNNEDYLLWGTYMWFHPGYSGEYGAVYFGFKYNDDPADGYAQGGMNTEGLSCDGNGLPEAPLNPHPEKPRMPGPFMQSVLEDCATVNETIAWCKIYDFGSSLSGQVHFADAYGDSVVVSAGPDQELAFTRKNNTNYLVSTNINLADPKRNPHSCWRYDTAVSMLEDIKNENDLTLEAFRDILDAVHIEGTSATKYSNVFDLKTQEIYVYYNHDFSEYVKLNLTEELGKGTHEYRISDLFSPTSISLSTNFLTIEVLLISVIISTVLWRRQKKK
ncbi:MAG: hypothetical protein ACFFDI_08490 [Promethearchaeota archaeon]